MNMPEVLGTTLLQILEDKKLQVEVFPGKSSEQVYGFTDKALIYER